MTSLRHVGIVVKDLDKSINFWCELGFNIVVENIEPSPYINLLLGAESDNLRTLKLSEGSGKGTPILELLHFRKSTESEAVATNQIGITHIALTVSNFESTRAIIESHEGSLISFEPQISPNGKVKVAYFRCLDSVLLEIVEPL